MEPFLLIPFAASALDVLFHHSKQENVKMSSIFVIEREIEKQTLENKGDNPQCNDKWMN